MPLSSFAQSVYNLCRLIPRGKVSSYSELARALKKPGSARAIGNALNKNPFAPQVPCHRVVRADGRVGGFASGSKQKILLLKKEGLLIKNGRIDLKKFIYEFKDKK